MEDATLFANEVKMEEPKAGEYHVEQGGDHWETIHIAPAIINKDMDWNFRKP